MYFINQLLNGLQIGAIYALIALGYTMVYGIVKLINFAHGDLMMIAAYIALYCLVDFGLPLFAAILISMAVTALLGMLIERIAYKPLRNASRLSALITAIGVSLFLQNAAMLIFGSAPIRFPNVVGNLPEITIGTNRINIISLISIGLALVLMVVLQLFVTKSKIGKAMAAVSEDTKAAQLMGINVNRVISITFAIGSALAAFSAILYLFSFPQVSPFMGSMPGIKAFIAAVLGGIGIMPGAMLGGFLLGVIESLTAAYMPAGYSQLSEAAVFVVLILVLLFKPAGLLGRQTKEKV